MICFISIRLILLAQNIRINHSLWFPLNSKFVILLPKMVSCSILNNADWYLKAEEFVFHACLIFAHTVLIELFVVSPFSCPFPCIVILSGPAGYYLNCWQRQGHMKFGFWLCSIKAEASHKQWWASPSMTQNVQNGAANVWSHQAFD